MKIKKHSDAELKATWDKYVEARDKAWMLRMRWEIMREDNRRLENEIQREKGRLLKYEIIKKVAP